MKGLALDALQHAVEDDVVEGQNAIPVENAEEAAGLEDGLLVEIAASGSIGFNAEFEKGDAGEFHFGTQGETPVAFESNDAPEIDGFAVAYIFGVAATAA